MTTCSSARPPCLRCRFRLAENFRVTRMVLFWTSPKMNGKILNFRTKNLNHFSEPTRFLNQKFPNQAI